MSRKCPQCSTEYTDDIFFCGQDGTITVQVQDPADFDRRLGEQLGGYIVVARVADGAMGRVYEGRHPATKARVAVKVLHAEVAQDEVAVERFRREYETAREFSHPNIVQVLEFGETKDDSWFLTMEYLEGEELGQLLRREKTVAFERTVRIMSQFAAGLDHAHSFGVIHRDLKPDNVFLCRGPEGDDVRILDFGSVKLQMETGPKLTAFGTTLGSPYYMSPEQAMGKQDVDLRTDVFAATAILYEMLTGKVAFEGGSVAEILMKIVNGKPDKASSLTDRVPPQLDEVFEKGFAKDKTKRFGSASEMVQAFVAGLGLEPNVADRAKESVKEIRQTLQRTSPTSVAPPRASVPSAAAAAALKSKSSNAPRTSPSAPSGGSPNGDSASKAPFTPPVIADPGFSGEYKLPQRQGRSGLIIGVVLAVVVVGLIVALTR